MHVKLCDFGFACAVPFEHPVPLPKQLKGFVAPEVLQENTATLDHRADIFSYGNILYEITHAAGPFEDELIREHWEATEDDFYQILGVMSEQNFRPPMYADKCPEPMITLISQCWRHDPDSRPSTGEVLQRLQNMKSIYDHDDV